MVSQSGVDLELASGKISPGNTISRLKLHIMRMRKSRGKLVDDVTLV